MARNRAQREAARFDIEAGERELLQRITERRPAELREHLARCGLRSGHPTLEALSGELKLTSAVDGVTRWLQESGKPFCLLRPIGDNGGHGTGKSVAAGLLLLTALRRTQTYSHHHLANEPCIWWEYDSRWAFWVTMSQIRFAERFSANDMAIPLFDRLLRVPRLVIDEIRDLDMRGDGRSKLEDLIDCRQGGDYLTVMTTNHGASEFRALVGERICSRLSTACRVVEVSGADMRRNRP